MELLGYLEQNLKTFSKRQRQLAGYILEHDEKAAYLTAAQLAGEAGVSESTVVRFAAELG